MSPATVKVAQETEHGTPETVDVQTGSGGAPIEIGGGVPSVLKQASPSARRFRHAISLRVLGGWLQAGTDSCRQFLDLGLVVSSDGIRPRAMPASNPAVLRTNPDAGECREEACPPDHG